MANVRCFFFFYFFSPTSLQHAAESEGGFVHQTEDRGCDERAGLTADVM